MSSDGDRAACAAAAEVCACFNLRRASRAVTQLFDATLQPAGIRSTQFVLLSVAYAHEPAPLPRLAELLGVDRSTLTRNLQPLTRGGFVRVVQPAKSRASVVKVTARGRRKITETVPLWETAQKTFLERVGSARWDKLLPGLSAAATANRTKGSH